VQEDAETPLRVAPVTVAAQPGDGNVLVLYPAGTGTQMTTGSPHFARTARPATHSGFTLIELLIVVAMIAVLATIAFPILLRARISSNEGVAVASLRTIHSAEAAFAATCGSGGYAQSLDDLALKPMGSTVAFITDPWNTNGVIVNGYVANLMAASGATTLLAGADTCNGAAQDAVTAFVGERHAALVGETGVRSLAVDTQGTMYMRMDGATIDDALAGTLVFQ
jgi:prepilin-type N-terminal cleavage/methylation domain-containing protein